MSKPSKDKNFCRVFELPTSYPSGYCFNGGYPVQMRMVDWFHPWPDSFMVDEPCDTWEQVVDILLPFLSKKIYVKPGRQYVLITDFGKSLVFFGGEEQPQ